MYKEDGRRHVMNMRSFIRGLSSKNIETSINLLIMIKHISNAYWPSYRESLGIYY